MCKSYGKYLLVLVVTVSLVCLSSAAMAGLLSVTNNNSNDGNDVYVLHTGALDNGLLVNIDRTHEFDALPAEAIGADYVQTANDDKTAGDGFSIDVTFDPGTPLFLSVDWRVGDGDETTPPDFSNVMTWVTDQGWVDTGLTWNKHNEADPLMPFSVYMLTPDGTSHTFYEQNDGGSRNMYSIAAIPEPTTLAMLAAVAMTGLLVWRRRR